MSMNKQHEYTAKLTLKNKRDLKRYLKHLKKKYRNGDIPIERALDFNFQWKFKKSPTDSH